jgi:preprotein translocase subunit SecG
MLWLNPYRPSLIRLILCIMVQASVLVFVLVAQEGRGGPAMSSKGGFRLVFIGSKSTLKATMQNSTQHLISES